MMKQEPETAPPAATWTPALGRLGRGLLLAIMCLSAPVVRADEDSPEAQAEAALRDGLPQAAIAPLSTALKSAGPDRKHPLGLLLARARLASGDPQQALAALDAYCDRDSTDTKLLRASAFAAEGGLEAAAELAVPLAEESREAALLLARIRFEQGDGEAARAALASGDGSLPPETAAIRLLLDLQLEAGDPAASEALISQIREGKLLPRHETEVARGRLMLLQKRPSDAADAFRETLESGDLPAPVRANAQMGLARALVELGAEARAREVLRAALGEAPNAFNAREAMQLWISLERKAGVDPSGDLKSWAAESGNRRALEAKLQLARSEIDVKRPESALALLEGLPTSPEMSAADVFRSRMLTAEALIGAGRQDEALEILDGTPARKEDAYRAADLRGRALSARGAHLQAWEAFSSAAALEGPAGEKSAALANALLAALAAEDLTRARTAFDEFRRTSPESPLLPRLAFLLAAAEARDGSIDNLAALARQSPATKYSFQAKLALAEWRLSRGEPAAAERILRTAADETLAEPQAAALAAAEIFAAESAGSRTREELVRDCRDFLAAHPEAPEATDIAFKLGELHALSGDHAAAESVLSNLAQSLPDQGAAALAKFLAAQSAARSMSPEAAARAMGWFDSIAQGNSPLRHRARLEQASLLLRDRKFTDALTLYERLLSGDVPPEVRQAALMEKGDTLLAMAAGEPDRLPQAAETYAQLASDSAAPPDWRDQAACKHAAALARAGRIEEALAAYHGVLSRPPGSPADSFWLLKAGLETGRLLEEQQDWRAAIAVYDQLASAGGAQREEMEQRARRLRLEHFIWEN